MQRFGAEFLFACALIALALHLSGFPEPRRPEIARICASTALPSKNLDRYVVEAYASGDLDCAERLARRALWLSPEANVPGDASIISQMDGAMPPERVAAVSNLAAVLEAKGEDTIAIKVLQDATATGTAPPSLFEQLISIQEKAGLKDEAEQTRSRLSLKDMKLAWVPPAASEGVADTGGGETRNPALVDIYYGTDRANLEKSAKQPPRFSADGAGALVLGRVLVTLPPSHRRGEVYDKRWSQILRRGLFGKNPLLDPVVAETEALSEKDFVAALNAAMAAGRKEAFVFIHGFNTSFEDAALRTAQMAYDLREIPGAGSGFHGVPLFYSWPSDAIEGPVDVLNPVSYIRNYTHDYDTSIAASRHLAAFLTLVKKETGAEHVWLIAHSMGGRVLINALSRLAREGDTQMLPKFDALFLAAPDIQVSDFDDVAREVMGTARLATLYVSSTDRALWLSKKLRRGIIRLGDVAAGPVIRDGLDTIDASLADTSFFHHNYFSESRSVLHDIAQIIATAREAGKRTHLQPAVNGKGKRFWVLKPCGEALIAC